MIEEEFIAIVRDQANITVLALGTRRVLSEKPTHHKEWFHPSVHFIMSDFQDGLDVDVIADIHELSEVFKPGSIDVVIALSVFEHVQRPWIAAKQIALVLKPGGSVYVQTHQSFPIHGFPNDYWRFTTDALRTLFEDAGLETVSASYRFPAQIVSEQDPGGRFAPAFLNVNIYSRKPAAQLPAQACEYSHRVA